ncbi:MAG TPA: DUF4920 domain-containing protein [Flavobacteriaceae bacterium]|nr:DUF4920 domain-containing protein [Flavobacteriaceae bacterium]
MKKIFFAIALGALLFACKSNKEEQTPTTETHPAEVAYAVFGDEITQDGAITKEEMTQIYARLQPGDTITTKFKTTINEVCQMKGCWMKLELEGDKEAMVKFKDYKFFVPKNAAGDEVIVEGKAFVKESTVSELKHYAEDAGESEAAIDQINESEKTFAFEAHGVLLKE